VVYLSGKADFGRLERIIDREGDRKEENTTRIRRVTLFHIRIMSDSHRKVPVRSLTHRTHNRSLPLEHVIASGTGGAIRGRITSKMDQLLEVKASSRSDVQCGCREMQYLVDALEGHRYQNLSCETCTT